MSQEQIFIDLLPADESGRVSCPGACAHCPMGDKGGQPKNTVYSAQALGALEQLSQRLHQQGGRIQDVALYHHGPLADVQALPLKSGVNSASFMIGVMPESAEEMREKVSSAIFTTNALLGGMPRGERANFNVITRLDPSKGLEIKEVAQISQAFTTMVDRILNLPNLRFARDKIGFRVDLNAVDPKIFEKVNPFHISMMNAQVFQIALNEAFGSSIRRQQVWSFEEREASGKSRVVKNMAEVELSINGSPLILYADSRLIKGGKHEDQPTVLPAPGQPLFLGLMPDHIWVQHSTAHTKDATVRIDYNDLFALLERNPTHGSIRDVLCREVAKRRW